MVEKLSVRYMRKGIEAGPEESQLKFLWFSLVIQWLKLQAVVQPSSAVPSLGQEAKIPQASQQKKKRKKKPNIKQKQ